MGDSAFNNSGNLVKVMKGLTKFDGRKPGDFRDFHQRLLGVVRQAMVSQIRGKPPNDEATGTGAQPCLDKAIANYDRANEDFYVILHVLTGKPA